MRVRSRDESTFLMDIQFMVKHLLFKLKLFKLTELLILQTENADQDRYLHGECLEMVHGLQALRGEVLNEVLTTQAG